MANRRKPKALKLMEGTYRPDRDHEETDFPDVPADAAPPGWLIGPEAVAVWHAWLGQLEAAGVITAADLTALGHLCNMHARAVLKWRAGLEPTAPQLTQLRLMMNEFGLTPTSRSKPAKAGGEGTNPFRKHNPFDEFDTPNEK